MTASVRFTHKGLRYIAERSARYIAVHCEITKGTIVNVAMVGLTLDPTRLNGTGSVYCFGKTEIKPLCAMKEDEIHAQVTRLL